MAGIEGDGEDEIQIENSIVADNPGGTGLGGFYGPGGSATGSYSDVCYEGAPAAAPIQGEGNFCAEAHLADEGNGGSVDVHESSTSPTIDVGSNALVPEALTKDFYGDARIVSGTLGGSCAGPTVGPARVDIGAAEAPGGTRLLGGLRECVALAEGARVSTLVSPTVTRGSRGTVVVAFRGLPAGRLSVVARFALRRKVIERRHGRRRVIRRTEMVTYGNSTHTGISGGNVSVVVKPTKRALGLLRRLKKLELTLTITFTEPGELAASEVRKVAVRWVPPKKHRRR